MKGRKSKRKKSYAVDDEVKNSDKESDKDETPDHLSSSSKSSSGSGVSCGSVARRTSHSERGSRYEVLIRPIIEGKLLNSTRSKQILECPPPYKELDEAPLNEVASSVAAKEVNKFSKTAQV